MRITFILLFSFLLTACDGLDFDSIDGSNSDEHTFTSAELAYTALFSSSLLSDSGTSNRDGFIVLFNSSSDLDEINLMVDNNDDALTGNYDWTIVNDEIQVTYPETSCTTSKTSETDLQFVTSGSCDGDNPENSVITGTLIKPIPLELEDLEGETIDIDTDHDVRYSFFIGGNVEISDLNSDGNIESSTTENGTYEESSEYNDIIKITNIYSGEHSLLILVEGDLSSGTIAELKYTTGTDSLDHQLNEVSIYDITEHGEWEIDSLYDDIDSE